MDFVSKPKRIVVCGAVGVDGPGAGTGDGAGAGDAETETPAADAVAGAVGELPHAIDADAATNAALDVRPRECFLSLRTT
jgi:hypothetical protein